MPPFFLALPADEVSATKWTECSQAQALFSEVLDKPMSAYDMPVENARIFMHRFDDFMKDYIDQYIHWVDPVFLEKSSSLCTASNFRAGFLSTLTVCSGSQTRTSRHFGMEKVNLVIIDLGLLLQSPELTYLPYPCLFVWP